MVPKKLLSVVENNLCVRCGACVGVCPHDCLFLDEHNFPTQKHPCLYECNMCLKVCPGLEVNFPKLTQKIFKKSFQVKNPMGVFQKILVGHSADITIREHATSGGVITQLLVYLLEKKKIDGVIVTIADPKKPWKAKPVIATTKDQILKSTQSRYCISPVNQLLGELRKIDGKYAFVGLPCHVHAIRKLTEIDPNLAKRIILILGLYCSITLETEAITDLVDIYKISSFDIKNVEFRSGKWPGFIGLKLKDGTMKKLHRGHIKNIYPILQRLYYPKRCLVCIDGSNELADISVADPWIRNKKGKYPYPKGSSLVIVRTDSGKKFLDMAQIDCALFLEDIEITSYVDYNLLMMKNKRKMAFLKMEKLKGKRIPVPNYNSILIMNLNERFNELIGSLTFIFGRYNFTRKLALRVALSPLGSLIKKISDLLKLKDFS